MTRVRFRRHAPPYMPGDVTVFDDDTALTLEGQGLVELIGEELATGACPPSLMPAA